MKLPPTPADPAQDGEACPEGGLALRFVHLPEGLCVLQVVRGGCN